jgi:hypothetical protein
MMTGQSPAEHPPVFLRDDDVARILQMPVARVQKLSRSGDIPGRKVGREWRYDPEAIRVLVQPQDPAAPSQPTLAGLSPRTAARLRRRSAA